MTGMGGSSGPGNSSIVAEFHHALADQGAIILVLLAVLFIGWNQLRSMQYRRAVARGEPFGARRRSGRRSRPDANSSASPSASSGSSTASCNSSRACPPVCPPG